MVKLYYACGCESGHTTSFQADCYVLIHESTMVLITEVLSGVDVCTLLLKVFHVREPSNCSITESLIIRNPQCRYHQAISQECVFYSSYLCTVSNSLPSRSISDLFIGTAFRWMGMVGLSRKWKSIFSLSATPSLRICCCVPLTHSWSLVAVIVLFTKFDVLYDDKFAELIREYRENMLKRWLRSMPKKDSPMGHN